MRFHWGHGILSFIILFIALCATFIVFSLRQHHDLVTENYYEEGANYSEQMTVDQRSLIYTDSIFLSTEFDRITFDLAPTLKSLSTSVQVYFYRASDKSKDFRLDLPVDSLPYSITRENFIRGRYQSIVSWEMKDLQYQVTKIVQIK